MPHQKKRGTGITERDVTVFDINDNQDRADLRELLEGRNRALAEHGEFGLASLQALLASENVLSTAITPPEDGYPTDSQESFARHITVLIRAARQQIKNENADLAASLAFDAGVQWATAVMKFAWERDALLTGKTAESQRKAALETNRKHKARKEERTALMANLVPKLGIQGAAKYCERMGLGSWTAIKRQYDRSN